VHVIFCVLSDMLDVSVTAKVITKLSVLISFTESDYIFQGRILSSSRVPRQEKGLGNSPHVQRAGVRSTWCREHSTWFREHSTWFRDHSTWFREHSIWFGEHSTWFKTINKRALIGPNQQRVNHVSYWALWFAPLVVVSAREF
jgi:hypothetical protein